MKRRSVAITAFFAASLAFGLAARVQGASSALSVVVQEPEIAGDVDASIAESIGEVYADKLNEAQVFRSTVSMSDVVRLVRHERTRELLGCDDRSPSCLAEIGGALGATHLASMKISRLGKSWLLAATLIDSRTARVTFRQTRTIPALEAAIPVVEELAHKAASSVLTAGAGGDEPPPPEAAAKNPGEDKREAAQAALSRAQADAKAAEDARQKKLADSAADMVLVPAGSFFFGCNAQLDSHCLDNEKPGRTMELPAFKIDRTEVTVADYEACVEAGACTAADEDGFGCVAAKWFHGKYPVNCVDKKQAEAFCGWKGKRLPTAREWEKAARGTDGRVFPWGSAMPEEVPAALGGVGDEPKPVGSFAAGASPYGALDMAGNVAEWTSSTYDESRFEFRGGGYLSTAEFARTSDRHRAEAATRRGDLGFRCAL